jgi:hypothetical protein
LKGCLSAAATTGAIPVAPQANPNQTIEAQMIDNFIDTLPFH